LPGAFLPGKPKLHSIGMECFTSAWYRDLPGLGSFTMKANKSAYDNQDVTLAGVLVIALFSMCIGIVLGVLIA
jgi:ABC-type proline/glycine betaine transport system permease subunit